MCGLDRYLLGWHTLGFVGVGLKHDSEVIRRGTGKERHSVQSIKAETDEEIRNIEA
jgi:hypothetical protein